MATIMLTAVGTLLGGPIGGAIGALAGRMFDQNLLFKPKGREGPRLSELQVQLSSYGAQVPQMFGAMRVAGTVIWATDLRESRTKTSGGKGQPSVTTYSYSTSFAVALSSRRIRSVGRIWADGNLLRGAAGDFKSALGAFRLHLGGQDQAVDPLIAAAQGIAVTPAHRGIAYAVFEDLQLADFGNRIPSLTFEIFADEDAVAVGEIAASLTGGALTGGTLAGGALVDSGAQSVRGYAASGTDIGAALAPLVEAHDLSLQQGDGALRLVTQDAPITLTIPEGWLIAGVNGKAQLAVERKRSTADAVPVQLSVRHYDPARDYQAGVQKAVRNGAGRRSGAIDLPAALDASGARAIAEARLSGQWAGRDEIDMLCGWPALQLAAGQVVALTGSSDRWRIVAREWEAMAVRLSLQRLAGRAGTVPDVTSGSPVIQPDQPHGATRLLLADLPGLDDAISSAPLVVAAAAGASDGWRRAALFVVQPESGEAVAVGSTALPARMGKVTMPPGIAPTQLADLNSRIEVEMLADWMTLEPADDAALARGDNLCLVGEELIQFGAVEQIGPRRFRLSRLWRGRRGSEAGMAGHGVDAPFVMIEAERLFPVPATMVAMGSTLGMIAIGIGDGEPAAAQCVVSGRAVRPLAPVGLRVEADDAGGLTLRWTRRSRAGWRWIDGVDAPLGEEREAYRIAVMDGDIVVRMAETDAPFWTYDAAMRATDAAAGHGGMLTAQLQQLGTFAPGAIATINLSGDADEL